LLSGIAIAALAWRYHRQLIINNNRHALLCETLKPGMSISEVAEILKSKGNVIIDTNYEGIGYIHYSVLFTDKEIQDLYGGWTELDFVEGKYSKAYIVGFDYYEEICDFGLKRQNQ
jgi:hypothetical protein